MDDKQRIRQLEVEIYKLKTENRRLRKAVRENSRFATLLEKAHEDALLMLTAYIGYADITRNGVEVLGITKRRWENARALCLLARIHNGRKFLTTDLIEAERRLDCARNKALEEPENFHTRLPRYVGHHRRTRAATMAAQKSHREAVPEGNRWGRQLSKR